MLLMDHTTSVIGEGVKSEVTIPGFRTLKRLVWVVQPYPSVVTLGERATGLENLCNEFRSESSYHRDNSRCVFVENSE